MRVTIETDTETPLFGIIMSMVEKDVDAAMVKIPVATKEQRGTVGAIVVVMGMDMEAGPEIGATSQAPKPPMLEVVPS